VFKRMVKQANQKSIRHGKIFKYGYEVPRSYADAMRLDKESGQPRWLTAVKTELEQIMEYQVFDDRGKGVRIPHGYKMIRCHFVFDVKHDGRHKARYVAGGHMTDPPLDSVYSGVVTLRSLRLCIFLAELNGLTLYAADVGNAYLEAKTKERICIIAGPEFAIFGLEGHVLVIIRALYGLKTSGARWHERFADSLREEGFTPCKADTDVWLRRVNDYYEYICVYVDDLAMAMKDPAAFCEVLKNKHGYKLKGDGPLKYHLGCDFGRDPDGTFYYGPFNYVEKMMDTYERLFGEKPKGVTSPLEKGDHPELDTSPEVDEHNRSIYMSMVGQCQWLISLGRLDIAAAIMTMSRFRIAPREGHMKRMKRIYGYLKMYPKGAIRVRTEVPNYETLKEVEYDWTTIYGNVKEELPYDMPEPLGKMVITTTYEDANLYHDYLNAKSVTGILHLVNQTPIDWYCKRQATVETTTYGSEFNAARAATEQIMDLRYTLRMLGVPIGDSYMFGDNQSVVTNSTVPHSKLNKRHNALAYHRVREAIAAKILKFFHIEGKNNPADVLSKHCGHQDAWPHVKVLLFWRGDTSVIPDKGE
ncbi:MAG: reverse transcriptase domain-containing protein, partial [Aeromonas sp.]